MQRQTWYLSKNLHRLIFRPKILQPWFCQNSTVLVIKTQLMSKNGENYTAGKNFTLPLAVTALTNLTSGGAFNSSFHSRPTVHSGAFPSLTGLFWAIFTTQRRSPFCFWDGMEFNIGWNAAGGPWLTSNQQNKDTINKSSTEKYESEHFTTLPVLKTKLCGNNKELTEICLFTIYLLPKND